MFDHLDWLATWAGNLCKGVFRVEPLGVFPNEGMACYNMVKGCICDAREINFFRFFMWGCIRRGGHIFSGGWGGGGLDSGMGSSVR